MAKQTFTTGQVLTAAQLTNLQQTAMSGGAAQAKTSSYVLVATDAGTAISMTSTSATTVTVNTGLFAAGDTVFIQNLGSGNLTITAGTATVNTAGSLILPQYDAGILYFVSASSAIFYDYIQVGAASPLTTKGDLYTFSTSDTRLGVGANGTTLVADSSEATGLKWQAASAAGANWSLLNSGGTALTGTSVSITGISGKDKIMVLIKNASFNTGLSDYVSIRFNSDSGSNYYLYGPQLIYGSSYTPSQYNSEDGGGRTGIPQFALANNAASFGASNLLITGCNAAGVKVFQQTGGANRNGGTDSYFFHTGGYYDSSSTISSVQIIGAATFDGGTVYVYTSA